MPIKNVRRKKGSVSLRAYFGSSPLAGRWHNRKKATGMERMAMALRRSEGPCILGRTVCDFFICSSHSRCPLDHIAPDGHESLRNRSLHLFQQLPRFTQQRLNLPSLGDRIPGEQAMLARVLVRLWRAGSQRAAVHGAALLAVHRRRAAGVTGLGFRAATR
jgi:hypothetical protein